MPNVPTDDESDGPAVVLDSDIDLGDPTQRAEVSPREWDIVLAVGVGGVLGADARYGIGRGLRHSTTSFPWSTLIINVTGCLAIGLLMIVLLSRAHPPRLARPFLGVGILGGYTTYSTFATDVVGLVVHHRPALAGAYLASTVAGCAAAVWFTATVTQRVIDRRGGRA